jgi:hypothetical protein
MFTRQLKMCWLRISIGNYEINKGNEECRPGNIEITIMAGVILGYFKICYIPFLLHSIQFVIDTKMQRIIQNMT